MRRGVQGQGRSRRRPGGPLLSYTVTAATTRSATEAAGPALLLAVTASGRPASTAALLVSCLTAASAVMGPVVGAALDAARRPRRLFVTAILLLGVVYAVLGAVLGDVPVPVAAALVVTAGLGQPALTGGWTAQLPRVLPAGLLPRGYAVDGGTYNLAAIVGPAIGAAALALGPSAPLFAVSVIVVAGLATLPLVPLGSASAPKGPPTGTTTGPTDGARHPAGRRLLGGLHALVSIPRLRANTVVTTVGLAGQAALVVGAPGLSRELSGDLHLTAWLLVSFAVGGLASTALLAVRPFDRGHDDAGRPTASPRCETAVIGGTVAVGLGMALVALAPVQAAALLGTALMGVGDGVLMTGMFLVRAAESPADVRSQVFTVAASVRTSAYALTTAGLAPLADEHHRTALWVGAAVQLLALVLGALTAPRRRRASGRASVPAPGIDG